MKELFINTDNYNENYIKTIEGDNLSEVYKIYICKNERRVNLTNKIAIMAYVGENGNEKRNILALNITNATKGEIELPITNVISKHNGVYACQIAIYGENNFLEQTAPFNLIVENNIFSEIANTAINSTDFKILSEAIKTTSEYAEKLQQGTESIELQYADKLNKKLDKDGIVTMANMGQDVRKAMTGGSVPIVGEDSVDSINLKDGSVTLSKINTDTKEYIDGKLEKLKLENLILNPTFDSIDNWILTAARAETENNICTLTATSQWGNIKTNIIPTFSEGDLVYISATIKTNTPNVKLEFGDYITSGYPAISLEISPSQEYTDVSGVVKINSNFANKELSCCIVDHNGSNWQPIYIKGVTVINLTKEFNGATENINKETIDNIIKNSVGALFFKNIIYLNSINTDITPSLRDSMIEEKHIKGKSISLEKLNEDVLNLINTSSKNDKNNLKVLAESNNYVRIISNYSKKDNLSIFLQRTGSNDIFNIKKISLLDKVSYAETVLCQMGTDWLGPYEVAAKNNIDGEQPNSHYMTGGNHAYNDQESYTESDTGRTLEVKIFIDNELLEGTFDGECKKVKIIFKNKVQAFNTTKHDGSGREVLEENYTITCVNSGELKIENVIKALEPIEILKYYGLQALNEPWNGEIFYYSDANKKINSPLIQTNSGGKECEKLVLRKNNNKLTMKIDRTTGLGRLKAINPAAFSQSFGKTYFNLINTDCTQTLDTGEIVTWAGSYTFESE